MTLALAFAVVAFAVLSAIVLLAGRRRRRRAGEIRIDRLPAGMKELVSHVGALSSFGMGLRLPPQGVARRRVGTLIGVR